MTSFASPFVYRRSQCLGLGSDEGGRLVDTEPSGDKAMRFGIKIGIVKNGPAETAFRFDSSIYSSGSEFSNIAV